MSKTTYFVDLDYHQHSVQVCVLDSEGTVIKNVTRMPLGQFIDGWWEPVDLDEFLDLSEGLLLGFGKFLVHKRIHGVSS